MENSTIDLIHRHASARHFKPDKVTVEQVESIVSAAQSASTSSNLQAYSVVAVTDQARREKLAFLCGDQAFIKEAPVFLAWCADLARLERVCELRGQRQVTDLVENFLVAAVDAALAAENAALAAESLGLGICFVGAIRNNPAEVIDLLELPRLTFPITGMSIGWKAREPRLRPRLPIRAILHWEAYRPDHDPELYAYDQAMLKTGIYKGRQVPAPGKPEVVEDYGWLEHTARRVARADRAGLRAVLEKQGFGLK
ncbi:MAG TPA: nitroreductase family protein [Anaerolineales bacterium]|nr:nitroreductase family protein [Anaerolineales bacterium]